MTPIGHASVSYLGARAGRLPLLPFLIGGVAPDVDFFLLPLTSFNALHRVVTHNVFFVAAVALVCAAVSGSRSRAFVAAVIGGGLHLLVDSMLDSNPSNGIGVAALWPISGQVYSPYNLVSLQCDGGWSDAGAMVQCALPLLLWEVPFWVLAGALLTKNVWRRGGGI